MTAALAEQIAPAVTYCARCLYPDTKPDLYLDDEGVCSACRSFEARAQIDWEDRRREFKAITDDFRNPGGYDCIVPVSGGKDSTTQTIRLLELGLTPLAVTATTDDLSEIGRRNIENLQRLGVDHIAVTTNPVVRRRINRITLSTIGDISWAEHVTIFTIPVRLAIALGVRLIVWGENPQNEYGGPRSDALTLTRSWLEEFGGLNGLRVRDFLDEKGIGPDDLIPYCYPADEDLERVGVVGVFMGQYFPWDGFANALVAQAHGFEVSPKTVEGSLACYENLDNHQTGIHDYFKYLKFGFGRATDIASNHIRRGRMTRERGVQLVRKHDGRYPHTCLGKPLDKILDEIGMSQKTFDQVCDKFTNTSLFLRRFEHFIREPDGRPQLKHPPC